MKSPVRRLAEKVVAAKARHEERHRPTSFELAIASRIQLLHPAAWDSIASSQSFFLSRPFLQLLEDHCPENIRPRYALISHKNTPRAIVVAQVAVLEGERLMKSPEATPSKKASDTKASALQRKNGVLVGFITSIKDQELAVGYHIGFDRQEAGTGTPLYLALLQTTVRHAIELGCQKLSLGRTALEPKARLGAQPVPLHFWVRHKNPAVNLVLRRFLGFVPHDEAPDRNPFKEPPAT